MTIDDAALATRKFAVWRKGPWSFGVSADPVNLTSPLLLTFKTRAAAARVRDRLNLIAVLEAIREPNMGGCARAFIENHDENPGGTWRVMIDRLISEASAPDLRVWNEMTASLVAEANQKEQPR